MITTVLVAIPLIFIMSFYAIKKSIPAWGDPERGFIYFDKKWKKAFAIAGAGAVFIATGVYLMTDQPILSLITGVLSGLFGIAAWTDSIVGKVPSQISDLTTALAFTLGISALFFTATATHATGNALRIGSDFLPRISSDDVLIFVGGGIAVGLAGFLIWMKNSSALGALAICASAVGFFFAGYAPLTLLGSIDPYWHEIGIRLSYLWIFLMFTVAFDFAVGSMIGGADVKLLYATAWGFSWWLGPYLVFVILLIAVAIQCILHFVAKPLKLGIMKDIKTGPFKMMALKRKWKKEGLEGTPPTRHQTRALPFLPVMATTLVVGTLTVLSVSS